MLTRRQGEEEVNLRKRKSQEQIQLGVEYFFYVSLRLLERSGTLPIRVSEAEKKSTRDDFFNEKAVKLSGWLRSPEYGLWYYLKIETLAHQFVEFHIKSGTADEIKGLSLPQVQWEHPLVLEVLTVIEHQI
jgi:hypothetical protein